MNKPEVPLSPCPCMLPPAHLSTDPPPAPRGVFREAVPWQGLCNTTQRTPLPGPEAQRLSHRPRAAQAQPFPMGLAWDHRGVWGTSHLSLTRGQIDAQDGNGALRPGVHGAGLRLLVLLPGAISFGVCLPLVPCQEAPLDDLQEGIPCLAHSEGHSLQAEAGMSLRALACSAPCALGHHPTPRSGGCGEPTLVPGARDPHKSRVWACSPAEPHRLLCTRPSRGPRALRGCPRHPCPSVQPRAGKAILPQAGARGRRLLGQWRRWAAGTSPHVTWRWPPAPGGSFSAGRHDSPCSSHVSARCQGSKRSPRVGAPAAQGRTMAEWPQGHAFLATDMAPPQLERDQRQGPPCTWPGGLCFPRSPAVTPGYGGSRGSLHALSQGGGGCL